MLTLIALVIFAAWLTFAWRAPRTAFSFLPLALPFYLVRLKIGPLPTTALEMVVLGMIVGWLLGVFRHEKRWKMENGKWKMVSAWKAFRSWAIPCGLWLLAGAISVIVAPDHVAALGLYRAYFVEPVLLFFVGIGLMREENGKWKMEKDSKDSKEHFPFSIFHFPNALTTNLALVTIAFSIWAIFQYATGIGLPAPYAPWAIRRAVGPFSYPNALALFTAPVIALVFADLLVASSVVRRPSSETTQPRNHATTHPPSWLGWITVIAGLVTIILAKSDGGLIAIVAAMFVALILNRRTRIATIVIAVIGAIAIFAIPQVKTPVLNQLLFREWSGKVRVVMWKESVTMLKNNLVFGVGLAGYPIAIKPYHKATWMEIFQYPHNIALNLWSETGLLGVVAFGWMVWRWMALSQTSGAIAKEENGKWKMENGAKEHFPFSIFHFPSSMDVRISLPVITAILVHGIVDVPYFKNDLAIVFFLLILITTSSRVDGRS
ncbi:MAG: O-antigen ligase family protein [Candidatus Shapirobacteria bacterium]|jgi:hypothetical protein